MTSNVTLLSTTYSNGVQVLKKLAISIPGVIDQIPGPIAVGTSKSIRVASTFQEHMRSVKPTYVGIRKQQNREDFKS